VRYIIPVSGRGQFGAFLAFFMFGAGCLDPRMPAVNGYRIPSIILGVVLWFLAARAAINCCRLLAAWARAVFGRG
jgi:hypothetical protein